MSLKEDLASVIPGDTLSLPGHYELIGDVAVISLLPGMEAYKAEVADAILAKRKNIRTVLYKLSKTESDRRVPRYEVLRGKDTVATYKEYGFSYRFDISRVFFNPGLKYERHRVAAMALSGENVLLPFAGSGPFAIPLAAKGCHVLAIEKSAEACKWLNTNASLNRVDGNIDILNADALDMPYLLKATFDRAVVPAPYGMDEALDIIAPMVRTGGMVHFYAFKKKHQIQGLIERYGSMGLSIEGCRRCGNVAPGVSRWAFDLLKQ
ncbi:MAG TPA: class I SAM-dependent methyltransferase family protein [Methanocella sp.]|uniref:class I SAM-dependent methyltransferase n=1 Tax=Methanocella sp. TaxID=2052833 RepID=UPI002C0C50DF|nr:class I SAM-dependent methyltransferase family protein [Methanocella sp.]HTY89936.1 class I SAM-dependent methyltransferase family protein [Methanocella sp.]